GHGGGADDSDLATGQRRLEHIRGVGAGAKRRTRADDGMRLVYKQHQVVAFFDLAYDSLYPLLEHPPQHRTRHYSGHLELDEVGISQPLRHAFGLEFYLAGQAFDHRRLADPGLSYEHRGVRPLAMTQNFDHLADLFIPADHRRELVLASELVQA